MYAIDTHEDGRRRRDRQASSLLPLTRRDEAGIVIFPGINRERDMAIALDAAPARTPRMIWHKETDLAGLDLVVMPGGFSLRRLSALRRHGGAVAGDARGARASPRAAAMCSACATASRS